MCGHDRRLFVALELTEEVPESPEDLDLCLRRWVGEPVKTVVVPSRLFLTNKSGYPVLSKEHQDILKTFFRFKIHVVVKGMSHHHSPTTNDKPYYPPGGMALYLLYIKHLHAQEQKKGSSQANWYQPYNDHLQAPLQPLMDNLESQIYETFERDPVKYERYEAAVVKALRAIAADATRHAQEGAVVVTVVGAGRGPLVAATLAASSITGTVPLTCMHNVHVHVHLAVFMNFNDH